MKINWEPDPIYVMDIHMDIDGNPSVLELNSFSCSGLYGCEADEIVETASDIALKEWQEINSIGMN